MSILPVRKVLTVAAVTVAQTSHLLSGYVVAHILRGGQRQHRVHHGHVL